MKIKSLVTIALVVFVAASLAYLVFKDAGTSSEAETITLAEETALPPHHIIAYYFHGTQRCKTCLHIESAAKEAIEAMYPEELADGRLEWKAVNFEEEANAEMATKYELVASSLVIVEFRDGQETQWKTLDKVWDLVWDEEPFAAYVVTEVGIFLNAEKTDG